MKVTGAPEGAGGANRRSRQKWNLLHKLGLGVRGSTETKALTCRSYSGPLYVGDSRAYSVLLRLPVFPTLLFLRRTPVVSL